MKQPKTKFETITLFICLCAGCISMYFIGCGLMQTKPSICDGITDSLICERIPNPQVADVLLQVGNLALINEGVYSKEETLEFLADAEKYIEQAATYAGVVKFIAGKLKLIPPELMALAQSMESFRNVVVPITDTDRRFLLAHIAHQRAVVELVE